MPFRTHLPLSPSFYQMSSACLLSNYLLLFTFLSSSIFNLSHSSQFFTSSLTTSPTLSSPGTYAWVSALTWHCTRSSSEHCYSRTSGRKVRTYATLLYIHSTVTSYFLLSNLVFISTIGFFLIYICYIFSPLLFITIIIPSLLL